MSIFLLRRGTATPPKTSIRVTITGTGKYDNTVRSSATINGTAYSDAATSIEVESGDNIIFSVIGYRTASTKIIIDGTTVVTNTGSTAKTYTWTVPDDIDSITIAFSAAGTSSQAKRYFNITVTTS